MNFGEVIQTWKEGFSWIDNSINPYVMRDMTGVMKNPLVPGEVIVTFTILDRTVIVNEEVYQYQTDMEYHTLCLNGTSEEKGARSCSPTAGIDSIYKSSYSRAPKANR